MKNYSQLKRLYFGFLVLIFIVGLTEISTGSEKYDPLTIVKNRKIETVDLTVKDSERQRLIPLRVYLPKSREAQPVVIFSHGLGGSCKNNPYLGNHWAARGYVAVFMQHPGSDETVWKNKPVLKRIIDMKKAANLQNYLLRVQDVPKLIDTLKKWNKEPGHVLNSRMDLEKIGMSGHSFGAVTTQAVSGQTMPFKKINFTDDRIIAAVMFSPSVPNRGRAKSAFGKVSIPWMLMTGTKDNSLISKSTAKDRLKVYPALPSGRKYELVLYNAEHSAFADRALPGDKEKRNPNHHRAILAFTTAFWDTYLRDNQTAKLWLEGDGAKSVLEKQDRWQFK